MSRPIPSRWKPYPGDDALGGISLFQKRTLAPELRNFRNILVALPPTYHENPTRHYPVVYMQDGQNLFDPATSFAGAWQLGHTLADAAAQGIEAIVVGVANAKRRRLYEYSPFPDRRLGGGGGDRYLAFLTDTLKPAVDRDFRTLPARESTTIAGSSMGGLISLYAVYRRADIFGAAAALSPSLWFANRSVLQFVARCRPELPPRLYLDIGLSEPPGAIADVRALRGYLLTEGYREGAGFDYLEDEAGGHDEGTWGRRSARALEFLLRPPSSSGDGPLG